MARGLISCAVALLMVTAATAERRLVLDITSISQWGGQHASSWSGGQNPCLTVLEITSMAWT